MKKIGWAFIAAALIIFISIFIMVPISRIIGYSSVQGSYHALTHSLLVSLIFTIILCTMTILEEFDKAKARSRENE